MMDVNWFSYCGNHFVVHAYINYLCCALKTNIICQLYITKIVCWRYQLNCTVTTKTCECPLRIPSLKTVCVLCHFGPVWLFVTPWTITLQAPLSMGFSRQKYWSGLPFLPPGDLPDWGIEPVSLMSPALTGRFFTTSTTCLKVILY